MSKKTKCKLGIAVIIGLIVFILGPVLINILASIPNPYVKGAPDTVESTWISFWGSYLGGFFSSLMGASVSGFVAYLLIAHQSKSNRDSDMLLEFSIMYNKDFQYVKTDIIQSMVNMHICLQNYHMELSNCDELKKNLHDILEHYRELQMRLNQTINTHVLLLQYVKEQQPDFDPNLLCDQYTELLLECNRMRIEYVKSLNEGAIYDVISDYNTNVIPKGNMLRATISKTEQLCIQVLFSVLKTQKEFALPTLQPITKKDYDKLMPDTVKR